MNPLPRLVLRVAMVVLGAALAGGCATKSSPALNVAVVWHKDGKVFVPTQSEVNAARGSVDALLAKQNLRMVEEVKDAAFVAAVDVRATGTEGKLEATAVRSVARTAASRQGNSYHGSPQSVAKDLEPLTLQIDKLQAESAALWARYP